MIFLNLIENFKKGDRVVLIQHRCTESLKVELGETGTVKQDTPPKPGLKSNEYLIPVEWDKSSTVKHSCAGMCKKGYGGWVIPVEIQHC